MVKPIRQTGDSRYLWTLGPLIRSAGHSRRQSLSSSSQMWAVEERSPAQSGASRGRYPLRRQRDHARLGMTTSPLRQYREPSVSSFRRLPAPTALVNDSGTVVQNGSRRGLLLSDSGWGSESNGLFQSHDLHVALWAGPCRTGVDRSGGESRTLPAPRSSGIHGSAAAPIDGLFKLAARHAPRSYLSR